MVDRGLSFPASSLLSKHLSLVKISKFGEDQRRKGMWVNDKPVTSGAEQEVQVKFYPRVQPDTLTPW